MQINEFFDLRQHPGPLPRFERKQVKEPQSVSKGSRTERSTRMRRLTDFSETLLAADSQKLRLHSAAAHRGIFERCFRELLHEGQIGAAMLATDNVLPPPQNGD